jgi:O-acetyl-ADP-ribose deacetylase (regulator of RNase III)
VHVSPRRLEALARDGTVDAVVSSDDTELSMGGGVSAALLAAAGSEVREEAARLAPLTVGDVVVTSAGGLGVRYIFHAVTVDWQRGILPTATTIRHLTGAILRRCEVLGIHRLGVSALATGAAGFAAEESAWIMVRALAGHVANATVLQSLTFALPDPSVREAFSGQLAAITYHVPIRVRTTSLT